MSRRGAVLFELIVSLAIFIAGASLTLGVTRNVLSAVERTHLEQEAADLARSRLAELEAGLVNLSDLTGGRDTEVEPRWIIDVNTERSPYRGLTLVELTVTLAAATDEAISVTLRQLVRLRELDTPEYESDELMEDLPEAETEPAP